MPGNTCTLLLRNERISITAAPISTPGPVCHSSPGFTTTWREPSRTCCPECSFILPFLCLLPIAWSAFFLAHVSIHKRILSFLGLLAGFIAIIYAVHPAFQLTYSPLVVILAFFILGLSALVAMILFLRFEQEMQSLQRQAHVAKSQAISLWGAFVAAFSIGVSNLRRRKVRTTLTCATLIILTYTLLNFTSVRNALDLGAVVYKTSAPYQGLMLKAPEWKSLPADLSAEMASTLPAGTLMARRVWWETADKTRPPAIALRFKDKEAVAAGLVGLDPGEASLTAQDKNMVEGSWLDAASSRQLLLSRHLADAVGDCLPLATTAGAPLGNSLHRAGHLRRQELLGCRRSRRRASYPRGLSQRNVLGVERG